MGYCYTSIKTQLKHHTSQIKVVFRQALIFHHWHLLTQRLLPRATGHSNTSEQKRYMTRASTSTWAVSSHHAGPNCRKTVPFSLYYFPESLTKSVCTSFFKEPCSTHKSPPVSPFFLWAHAHSRSCAWGILQPVFSTYMKEEGYRPPRFIKGTRGPKPYHQQTLKTFDSIICFWLNSPTRPCLPLLGCRSLQYSIDQKRDILQAPFGLHGYLGNTRIYSH